MMTGRMKDAIGSSRSIDRSIESSPSVGRSVAARDDDSDFDWRESMATTTTTTIVRASAFSTRTTTRTRARTRVMASKSGAPGTDNSYLLLTLEYVEDMVEKRGPHREEHLAGARKGFDEGKIVMAGALMDPVDAGVFVFKNCEREEVEAFVEADAYYKAGLIPGYSIRPWMVVVGN